MSISASGAISGGGVNGGSEGVNEAGDISLRWERIEVDCTLDLVLTRFLDAALRLLFETGFIKLRVSNKVWRGTMVQVNVKEICRRKGGPSSLVSECKALVEDERE